MKDLRSCVPSILNLDAGNERQKFYIAYSGGIDSHVLLHLCASVPQIKHKLVSVYIHHGLQPEAESWSRHCENTANGLSVEFLMRKVNAHAVPGESPEEAARNARYTALKSLMNTGDVLLLAQHRDDQLETVFLQLFRGSGLRGLSGMPEQAIFGKGVMLRPMLNVPKQQIVDYANQHRLSWVEDPSNRCNDYDRNFLRNAVLPLLKQRWPAIDKTVARSAKHCSEAQVLVDEVAEELFDQVFNPVDKTLNISRLIQHHVHQQQLIVRRWFRHMGLKMPAQAFVERILTEVVAAAEHRDPMLQAQNYCIRRYRDELFCLTAHHGDTEPLQSFIWPAGQESIEISHNRTLSYVSSAKGIPQELWQNAKVEVKFRQGGEKIGLPGRKGRHSLKNLFQEAGIPPWERERMPLIYLDGKLAAVGQLWIDAKFYSEKLSGCIGFNCKVKN